MKFLCGNCKAKYQIADDKIAGRTLRMKCRRCSQDIIIRGDSVEMASDSASSSSPKRSARPGSYGPRASRRPGSPLGTDFRRSMHSSSAPPPPPVDGPDEWHVAINDVPVGPIRRSEVGRKVGTGAVKADSLVWREGFDDWRPLREVPELSSLLRRPPPAPSPRSPLGRGIGGRSSGSRPRIRAVGRPPPAPSYAGRPAGASDSWQRASAAPPMARGAPTGGAALAAPELAVPEDAPRPSEPYLPPPRSSLSSIPQIPPPPASQAPGAHRISSAPPVAVPGMDPAAYSVAGLGAPPAVAVPTARRPVPMGVWIAAAGAVAFGVVLAIMVATKLVFDDDDEAPVVATTEPAGAQAPVVVEPEIVTEVPDVPAEEVLPPEATPEPAAAEVTRSNGRGRSRTTRSGARGGADEKLTAEQQALIRRMSQEQGSAPGRIRVPGSGSGRGGAQGGEGLNQQQIAQAVGKNRPSLQRCYETAVRGMATAPSVRLDVDVSIGGSGTVTRVGVRGQDVGGLRRCVESAVRRWRFPTSGGSSKVSFPVVFTAAS